jgi:hypothetical protein
MPPARKTAAKRPAADREPTVVNGEPLLELHTKTTTKKPAEMEPAFTINGTVFSVPVEVKAQVAIRYMDHCRKKGENWGLSWLLETILGEQAYEALLEFDDLEDEQLIAIAKIVQSKVIGDAAPKG